MLTDSGDVPCPVKEVQEGCHELMVRYVVSCDDIAKFDQI